MPISQTRHRRPDYTHGLIGLKSGDRIIFCHRGKETQIHGEIVGQGTEVWLIDTKYPTIQSASNRAYAELGILRKNESNRDWHLWKYNGDTLYQIYDRKIQ